MIWEITKDRAGRWFFTTPEGHRQGPYSIERSAIIARSRYMSTWKKKRAETIPEIIERTLLEYCVAEDGAPFVDDTLSPSYRFHKNDLGLPFVLSKKLVARIQRRILASGVLIEDVK